MAKVSNLKAYILNRFANSNANYTSWMNGSPIECEVIDEFAPDWEPPADAGIVITHMHYRWEEIMTLRRILTAGRIPILILSDGILEYRNTWENPGVAAGSMFQPLFGHKLACIGKSQARTVESWGAAGKCEVVGLPRLDEMEHAEYLPIENEGPFRLLVATANTPAFTDQQRAKVTESLKALKSRFEKNPWVNKRPLEVTWRVTDGLDSEIGLEFESSGAQKKISLSDAIELSDAVITTPSTLYLESVMKRRPTALLDFSNSPSYVNSAWTISSPVHINQVLSELAEPAPAKMLFQRAVLHDNLEMGVCSKSRLYALINTMVKCGVSARKDNTPINLPTRILSDPQRGIHQVEGEFDFARLYRDNPNFKITDVHYLQQELNQAVARLGQLPRDLDTKHAGNQVLANQLDESEERIREGLVREQEHLNSIDQMAENIAKKNSHIDSLEKLHEDSNERLKKLNGRINEQTKIIKELMQTKAQLKSKLHESQSMFDSLEVSWEAGKKSIERYKTAYQSEQDARLKVKTALDKSLENNANIMEYVNDVKTRLAEAYVKLASQANHTSPIATSPEASVANLQVASDDANLELPLTDENSATKKAA